MHHLSLILLPLILLVSPLATSARLNHTCKCNHDQGNYTANSTFQANLRFLAATLPTQASSSPCLSADATVGDIPDQVSSVVFCSRGILNASSCLACITVAFQDAQKLCPYNREVSVYYGTCYLHFYDNRSHPINISIAGNHRNYILAAVMTLQVAFQAIGFAWLLFLLLQEWRSRRRSSTIRPGPPAPGDR